MTGLTVAVQDYSPVVRLSSAVVSIKAFTMVIFCNKIQLTLSSVFALECKCVVSFTIRYRVFKGTLSKNNTGTIRTNLSEDKGSMLAYDL